MRIHGGIAAVLGILILGSTFSATSSGKARLDRGFGQGGIFSVSSKPPQGSFSGGARAIAESKDGGIVAIANETTPGHIDDLALIKLNLRGRLDRDFGTAGIRYTSGLPSWHPKKSERLGSGTNLLVSKNGGIVAAGVGGVSGGCATVSRFFPNGALKKSFGNLGRSENCLRVPYRPDTCSGCTTIYRTDVTSVSLDGKGRAVVGGQSYRGYRSSAMVMRLTHRGRLDRRFEGNKNSRSGVKGIVEIRTRKRDENGNPPSYVNTMAETRPLRHQKVLGVGSIDRQFAVFRFKANGAPDRSFSRDGIIRLNLDRVPDPENQCGCSYATGVDFDRQGRILVAGYIRPLYNYNRPQPVVLRFLKSGRLDRSFGRKGMARPILPKRMITTRIAIQNDGRIVVGGRYDQRFGLFRLKPGGAIDRSFFKRGLFAPEGSELGGMATDLLIDRKGRIVASGGGETASVAVVRILPG